MHLRKRSPSPLYESNPAEESGEDELDEEAEDEEGDIVEQVEAEEKRGKFSFLKKVRNFELPFFLFIFRKSLFAYCIEVCDIAGRFFSKVCLI